MAKAYVPKRLPLDPCPIEAVFAMVGGKWKARALYLLALEALSFAQLRRNLGKVSQQVLSTQLRALEADALVTRSATDDAAEGGGRYAVTAKGRDLVTVLLPVAEWGTLELARRGLEWTPPRVAHDRSHGAA